MTAELLQQIEKTKDKDGNVSVNFEMLKTIVDEGAQSKKDILTIIFYIRRLLTQLGILTSTGEIHFKVSAIVKALTGALLNTNSMENNFGYLSELGPVIMRYSEKTVADK